MLFLSFFVCCSHVCDYKNHVCFALLPCIVIWFYLFGFFLLSVEFLFKKNDINSKVVFRVFNSVSDITKTSTNNGENRVFSKTLSVYFQMDITQQLAKKKYKKRETFTKFYSHCHELCQTVQCQKVHFGPN